ncbi:MAG TPA: ABC transporter permease, partial [Steroidobacteraceae bacterium]|nr:ABC transporter permease [Steroidobacteraceae bacterium]
MFRNCLAAALRHLSRNKLYTAISVLGLSIGLCTALITALVIHNQRSHDHFIPGYDRIYVVASAITPPGHATLYYDSTVAFVGAQLALRFSEIQAVTRLQGDNATLRHANVEAHEPVYWADPNAFAVLPLPVVAGDLKSALARPDSIVLSRSIARKYFGRDTPLGETLVMTVDGSAQTHALSVAAVFEDLPPSGTHLTAGIFVSSLAPWTQLHQQDAVPASEARTELGVGTHTYVKLAPHASSQRVLQAMPTMAQAVFAGPPKGWALALKLVRLDRLDADPWLNPGFSSRLLMLIIVGFGILLIAGINFVNLLTARSARRAKEVSIRKLAGARRRVLALQFLTETIAYVLVASLVAVALTELLLPYANVFLIAGATFRYWQEPALIGAIAVVTPLLGALAGTYPALVLSALRPLRVLTGETRQSRRAGLMRQILVTAQFAILIGLIIAAAVVYQQRQFATQDALRIDTDQMLLIRSPCNTAFTSQVRALPGVRGLACSSSVLVNHGGVNVMLVKDKVGAQQLLYPISVEPSLPDLYGIKTVAGRNSGSEGGTYYLLNETAARQLGFASPADAIGYILPTHDGITLHNAPVIGVVPDFSLDSVEHRIEAQGFLVSAKDPLFDLISVKLTGHQIPETLRAIDGAWKATGSHGPINRVFLKEHIQTMYLAMLREAQLFGVFAAVAVVLACLGLLGLAASIAERRTREIGIRKALGADTGDIIGLLLRQFATPVLWANLI